MMILLTDSGDDLDVVRRREDGGGEDLLEEMRCDEDLSSFRMSVMERNFVSSRSGSGSCW